MNIEVLMVDDGGSVLARGQYVIDAPFAIPCPARVQVEHDGEQVGWIIPRIGPDDSLTLRLHDATYEPLES